MGIEDFGLNNLWLFQMSVNRKAKMLQVAVFDQSESLEITVGQVVLLIFDWSILAVQILRFLMAPHLLSHQRTTQGRMAHHHDGKI